MSAASFWEGISSGALRGIKPERKGWKITLRDDSLPHQIRISLMPGGTGPLSSTRSTAKVRAGCCSTRRSSVSKNW